MNSFDEHSGQFGATVCWLKWWRKRKNRSFDPAQDDNKKDKVPLDHRAFGVC